MAQEDSAAHTHPWKISDVVLFPMLGLGFLLEWLWPTAVPHLSTALRVAPGLVLFLGGGAMIMWSKRTLDAADQPSLPGQATTALVTQGAFRVSRNPNYLGAVMAVFGGGVLFDTIWVMAAAIICAIVLDRWMIRSEERYLGALFGDEYAQYCSKVRRWV